MAHAPRIGKRSNTSSIRQKPPRFPHPCHAQFGTSGIGAPPAGGVRTVRGMVSRGFHFSTFTITHTARRAPPGNVSRGRSFMAEYGIRSVGSIVTLLSARREYHTKSSRGLRGLHGLIRLNPCNPCNPGLDFLPPSCLTACCAARRAIEVYRCPA